MQFTYRRPQQRIIVQCPNCKGTNIGQDNKVDGAMWCNSCKHRVENKQKDIDILFSGGGEISPI